MFTNFIFNYFIFNTLKIINTKNVYKFYKAVAVQMKMEVFHTDRDFAYKTGFKQEQPSYLGTAVLN